MRWLQGHAGLASRCALPGQGTAAGKHTLSTEHVPRLKLVFSVHAQPEGYHTLRRLMTSQPMRPAPTVPIVLPFRS